MAWLDMRKKKQVTARMTESFARDLNLIAATYGLDNVSYILHGSVAAQADAIRARHTSRLAARQAAQQEVVRPTEGL
jgi:hypothetical protein